MQNDAEATFAMRLDHLYRTSRGPGKGPWTDTEVSDALAAAGAKDLTPSYLGMLRRGQRTNPTLSTIEALATFFKVPTAYLVDSDVAQQVDELRATTLRVTEIALAAMAQIVETVALKAAELPQAHHSKQPARRPKR